MEPVPPGFVTSRPGNDEEVPPLTNGGVPKVNIEEKHGVGGPVRFDYYAASVHVPKERLVAALRHVYRHTIASFDMHPGADGYDHRLEVSRWEREISISWGERYEWPLVKSLQGEFAPQTAQFCRNWPHGVTRMDSKFDVIGDWKTIADRCSEIARSMNLGTPIHRLIDDQGVAGGTLYIGSRKNKKFLMRVYDKTKDMLERKRTVIPDGRVRLESEYHPPKKEAKMQAATLEPIDLFGMNRTARAIYEEFAGEICDPVKIAHGGGNKMGTLMAMMAQYGDALADLAKEQGSWAAAGEYLECLHPEGEELRRKWMANTKARRSH